MFIEEEKALKENSPVLQVIPMVANVDLPIFVEIQHDMVELHTEFLFDFVLDTAKKGRVIVVHIDQLSAVFQREFGVRGICCSRYEV
jgi:hypothetical protein